MPRHIFEQDTSKEGHTCVNHIMKNSIKSSSFSFALTVFKV